jgi:tryptophanyl-tRNA synthetase
MANTFKSNVAANIVTSGNTVYTTPSATQTTLIGMTLSNKSAGTVTANVFLTRSSVDYSIISNAPILTGSTLVPIGGDQKVVLQAADSVKITTSANGSVDVIVSLLEIA